MIRLLRKVIVFTGLLFFLSILFSSSSFAQQCITASYQPSINNPALNVCTDKSSAGDFFFNKDCGKPSFLCEINPFCNKYSGQQCCTGESGGKLSYDFCRQTSVTPNGGDFWKYTIQCCFNPTPTPTPTPTQAPPTPTPGCSANTTCLSCTSAPSCGWDGSSCESGTSSSCPVNNTEWYWLPSDCPTNDNNNRCVGPTPTPAPQHYINGWVYDDINRNRVYDINIDRPLDTTSVSISNEATGNEIGTYSPNYGNTPGYYQTSPIYSSGSSYRILVTNVPPGCSFATDNPKIIQMPNANATESFAFTCTGPTPTPTRTPTPSPTGSPTPTLTGSPTPSPTPTLAPSPTLPPGSCTRRDGNNDGITECVDCDANGSCTYHYDQCIDNTTKGRYFCVSNRCQLVNNGPCPAGQVCGGISQCSVPPTPTRTPTPTPTPTCQFGEQTVTGAATSNTATYFSRTYWSSWCGAGSSQTSITQVGNNIRINRFMNENWCGYNTNVYYGIFNFSGFNIPRGTEIRSASLESPTAKDNFFSCEAGCINQYNGVAGPPPSGGINFGASMVSFGCGGGYVPNPICSPSTTSTTGQANVKTIIQNAVNSANLNTVSFTLTPQYMGFTSYAFFQAFLLMSADFRANAPVGPANLTIKYCAPPNSITGKIFNDANGDGKSMAVGSLPADSNYEGAVTITVSNGVTTFPAVNSGGNYTVNNLPIGQYTVTFSGLPDNMDFTYPPSSIIATVGSSCSCPGTSEGTCTGGTGSCASGGSGNVTNLNAGVTAVADAWFQSTGLDLRWDSGFSNRVPANRYAANSGTGGTPGIIFSGTTTPTFGSGVASPTNWQVSGNNPSISNRDVFTDTHNLIPSSYRFLRDTAESSKITINNLANHCGAGGIGNCTLSPTIPNGVYVAEGDLNLIGGTYTFPIGKNFVILINGNFNINLNTNGRIIVPVGSTVIFSAAVDIKVKSTVGENIPSSAAPDIDGTYSADRDFIADGNNNCGAGADRRLNIAGSVIANAGRDPNKPGTFKNNRTLCIGNAQNPSVSFIERPDFILNFPSFVRQTTRAWQEVAP